MKISIPHKLARILAVCMLMFCFTFLAEAQTYRAGVVVRPNCYSPYYNYGYNYYNRPYAVSPYVDSYYSPKAPKEKKIKEISEYAQLYEWQGNAYYYDGENYFRKIKNKRYELVEAPIGMKIFKLPPNTKKIEVGEKSYYQSGNTFYKELDFGNEVMYEIVSSPSN